MRIMIAEICKLKKIGCHLQARTVLFFFLILLLCVHLCLSLLFWDRFLIFFYFFFILQHLTVFWSSLPLSTLINLNWTAKERGWYSVPRCFVFYVVFWKLWSCARALKVVLNSNRIIKGKYAYPFSGVCTRWINRLSFSS